MLPTSAYFVVRREDMDGAVLFVRKDESEKWTLPGGKRRRRFASYSDFARESLDSAFDRPSILSLHLIAAIKGKIFIGFERTRCSVFECKIIGIERAGRGALWCFMRPDNVPANILSPDISGILPLIQSESRPA